MTLIGMADAAQRAGMTQAGIRRALHNAGINLVPIGARILAVEDTELDQFIATRPAGYAGRGRPPGAKNKMKEENLNDPE